MNSSSPICSVPALPPMVEPRLESRPAYFQEVHAASWSYANLLRACLPSCHCSMWPFSQLKSEFPHKTLWNRKTFHCHTNTIPKLLFFSLKLATWLSELMGSIHWGFQKSTASHHCNSHWAAGVAQCGLIKQSSLPPNTRPPFPPNNKYLE